MEAVCCLIVVAVWKELMRVHHRVAVLVPSWKVKLLLGWCVSKEPGAR